MKLRKNTITIELNKTSKREHELMLCRCLTSLKYGISFNKNPTYFFGDQQSWKPLQEKVYKTEVVSINEFINKIDNIAYHSRDLITLQNVKDYIFELLQENDYDLRGHMMLNVSQVAEMISIDFGPSDDLSNILLSSRWRALEHALSVDSIIGKHLKVFKVNGYSQGDFARVFVPAHLVKNDKDERNIASYLRQLLFDCPYLFRFTVTLAGVEQQFDFYAWEIDPIFKEINIHLNENGFDSLSQDEKEQLSEYFKSVDVEYN